MILNDVHTLSVHIPPPLHNTKNQWTDRFAYKTTRNHCVGNSPSKYYWKTTSKTQCLPGVPPPCATQKTTVWIYSPKELHETTVWVNPPQNSTEKHVTRGPPPLRNTKNHCVDLFPQRTTRNYCVGESTSKQH